MEKEGCGGQGRYGAAQRGVTSDPVLEKDSCVCVCRNTILPARSPLWLPAAPHNEDHCRGLPGQKGPLERRLPSGGLSALFLLATSDPSSRMRGKRGREKPSITMEIQGEQWALEGILTRNKQCQHLWEGGSGRIDRHSVGRGQKRALSSRPVRLKKGATVLFCGA